MNYFGLVCWSVYPHSLHGRYRRLSTFRCSFNAVHSRRFINSCWPNTDHRGTEFQQATAVGVSTSMYSYRDYNELCTVHHIS